MIHLISFLINLNITNELKCFLISTQNSFIIIDAILFAMGYITPHICNEFPPPNLIKSHYYFTFYKDVFFHDCILFSKLGLKTLIKAQNVSELDLVCC
jgi:hypothetical protein